MAGLDGADQEAQAEYRALAHLLDTANAVILSTDPGGLVTEWNIRTKEISGKPKDAVLGKPLVDQVHPDSRKTVEDAIAGAAKGDMEPPFEVQFLRGGKGDEDAAVLMLGLSPQFGPRGQVIGVLCVGQETPALRSERKASATDPGAARKSKDMVMHELRSPLHGIIGLANTLSQDSSPVQVQKPLKMIGTSAERVLELVTNVMDYWHLSEEVAGDVTQDAIDLNSVVSECVARCEQAKDKRGKPLKKDKVSVSRHVAEDLRSILGDQQGVSQMVYHLIMNALKFTHTGDVRIEVTGNAQSETVDIVVEDTGIGIGKANTRRVFEPFQQEDTSESRKYEGIGLGLAIVREVVRLHRGTVNVTSTPASGSTFRVTL
eukprot:CAMPEP_0168374834 /NCGR_PEP_ID=MMETSP0228-20121227/9503_1 /TAXON_ID=133427 /ORGANISM="Protoceratium reticulatum, Strain CCCM 535 (=CCMP 1889)" /LENGTH=374 /DNA_ID=CAMNT_0008387789 /DNA_START=93 /DNA_END=1214 /DNA_ORIENTATION=+